MHSPSDFLLYFSPPLCYLLSKDEAFGEFIGGSGRSSFNFSPLPTLSVHGQMGNGSVVTGYANPQSQLHQPQQQQDVQQQSAALPSLPVDDKYGTNVRSFFCSSDSSAGKLLAVRGVKIWQAEHSLSNSRAFKTLYNQHTFKKEL